MKKNYFIKILIFLITVNSYSSFLGLEFDSMGLVNIKEQNLKTLNLIQEIKSENLLLKDSFNLIKDKYVNKNEFYTEIQSLIK